MPIVFSDLENQLAIYTLPSGDNEYSTIDSKKMKLMFPQAKSMLPSDQQLVKTPKQIQDNTKVPLNIIQQLNEYKLIQSAENNENQTKEKISIPELLNRDNEIPFQQLSNPLLNEQPLTNIISKSNILENMDHLLIDNPNQFSVYNNMVRFT